MTPRFFPIYKPDRIASDLKAAQFDLVASLSAKKLGGDLQVRPIEQGWDLTSHLRPRQTIRVLNTTCARLRRPIAEAVS